MLKYIYDSALILTFIYCVFLSKNRVYTYRYEYILFLGILVDIVFYELKLFRKIEYHLIHLYVFIFSSYVFWLYKNTLVNRKLKISLYWFYICFIVTSLFIIIISYKEHKYQQNFISLNSVFILIASFHYWMDILIYDKVVSLSKEFIF